MPRQRQTLRQILSRDGVAPGLFYTLVLAALASWVAVSSHRQPGVRPGQVIDRAVVAQVPFESEDVADSKRRQAEAREKEPSIFIPNTAFLESTAKNLRALPEIMKDVNSVDEIAEELRKKFDFSEAAVEEIKKYFVDVEVDVKWELWVREMMEEVGKLAILKPEEYQVEKGGLAAGLRIQLGADQRVFVERADVVNLEDKAQMRKLVRFLTREFPSPVQVCIESYFINSRQPTCQRDSAATEAAREAAARAQTSRRVAYQPNQVLVRGGTPDQKSVLDEDGYRLLQDHLKALSADRGWWRYGGQVGLITLICVVLAGYVGTFKKRVVENPMRGLALLLLLLTMLGLADVLRGVGPYMGMAGPIGAALLAAVIVAIAYEQRFAIGISALASLLTAVALDLSIGTYLLMFTGCLLAIAQLKEVRHRGTLGRVGLVTGLVTGLGAMGVGLSERNLSAGVLEAVGNEAMMVAVVSVLVSFFVLGILPIIERAFKVTTSMSLLEICDVNRPLLRRLAQEAPGTYNHSLQVATLAEAAADSIGANGLQCRVGAYYHDIGKIPKPQYFIENQAGGRNRHEKLSPAMSVLIIMGHVKDGIEMAREYGLPRELLQFIQTHHGTSLVEYFYHAACGQRGEDEQVSEVEFRYPGPKPQTREAAILMICDGVESASRTMSEPTAGRIEHMVHTMVQKRLLDGQFDECGLTFAELRKIKQALTRTLAAMYHGRIAYPDQRREEEDEELETGPGRQAVG